MLSEMSNEVFLPLPRGQAAPSFFEIFLRAWKIAVKRYHNKNMEFFNNPTPEVVYSLGVRHARLVALALWGISRWGHRRLDGAIKNLK